MIDMTSRPLIPVAALLLLTTSAMHSDTTQSIEERLDQSALLDDHRPLFDDDGMIGWKVVGGKAVFEWDGSVLHGYRSGSQNTFLMSEHEYGDFILEGQVRIGSGNSGWQIRSHLHEPITSESRLYGYQIEVDPSERSWSGGLYDEGRRGWIHSLSNDQTARKAFVVDGWNSYRIEVIGPRIRSWVNDVPCADVLDLANLNGSIALQVHSGDCEVWWRNLVITDLGRSKYQQTGKWVVHLDEERKQTHDQEDTRGFKDDLVDLNAGDRSVLLQPISDRGLSLRFKYQLKGKSTIHLQKSESGETIVEIPLHDSEPVLERTPSFPVVAPGAGMSGLGDDWMELVIDLESGRLVVIDEGRVVMRRNGVELGDTEHLKVVTSCSTGTLRLNAAQSLVNE